MYSKELVVRSNHFENNSEHGLLFRDVLYSDIAGNRSLRNHDGIFLGGSFFNTINGNTFELYDLLADKEEKNNIATQHEELVKQMKSDLFDWIESCDNSEKGKDYGQ